MLIPVEILLAAFADYYKMSYDVVEYLWSEALITQKFVLETFLKSRGFHVPMDMLLGAIRGILSSTTEPIEEW